MKLIQPTAAYAEEISAYRQAFLDAGERIHGGGALNRTADPLQWLQICQDMRRIETAPENLVPATQFIYVREEDGKIVGMLQARHFLDDYLAKYAGHIGYSVRPDERRRGYAKAMLAAALPFCWQLGLERVMITCARENEASRRTILANGGVFAGEAYEPDDKEFVERYWIERK